MTEENISQEFRLKNIDETRIYYLEEIKRNDCMSKKHKKVCTISAFASLIGNPIGIMNFAIGLKLCAIAAGIKKYKSII